MTNRWTLQKRVELGLPPERAWQYAHPLAALVGNSYGLLLARETPPNVNVIGPVLPIRRDLSGHDDLVSWVRQYESVALLSLGTVTRWDEAQMSAMLRGLAQAVEDVRAAHGVRVGVLLAVREGADKSLPPDAASLHSDFRFEQFIPQFEILQLDNVHMMVSVGGINSVLEASALTCGRLHSIICRSFLFGPDYFVY